MVKKIQIQIVDDGSPSFDERALRQLVDTCRERFPEVFPKIVKFGGDSCGNCYMIYKSDIMKNHILSVIEQTNGMSIVN